MATDAQILAPDRAAGDILDPRRWLTLVVLLLAAAGRQPDAPAGGAAHAADAADTGQDGNARAARGAVTG